ncbi:hypothetical protein [Oceanihabitans sediminis]|uniref:Uncharacterized protein n=1 Tax=Oceanihabitans sediminis TaxID=1812012 RepID=A0A368PBD5_9FLAO|nr:hypothetical protein [Oceanihabitans sediminis]MDX1277629.1 hypothetical protein [Oceanihabitans sediminis]MDX1773196.1 hypothetical protein [Oceanihabitans sediminis]RBP34888.1 hypothetical protein DFR65_101788 [Oceanihabitans sediminis]RCU58531.1 hypothetical protein DU428_03905 [Oceanihabitans sediminis]
MKTFQFFKVASVFAILLCFSCGSTEKVITTDGRVYELKGGKFYSNGADVTEELSSEEKTEIQEILDQRLAFEKEAKEKKEALEAAQKKAEKARKEAEKKQKELEKKMKAKEDARKDFFQAKNKLKKQRAKYQKRLDRGKLSPVAIEKWEEKLKGLEQDVQDLEQNLKRY